MNLSAILSYLNERTDMGRSENIAFRCEAAKRFEDAGDYQSAVSALGGYWQGVGQKPDVGDLSAPEAALVKLRTGSVMSRIGDTKTSTSVQETALDILSEAQQEFESSGQRGYEAEACNAVAMCYWRRSEYENARALLLALLERLAHVEHEQKVVALLNLAGVEIYDGGLERAVQILTEYAALIEACENHRLLASYHSSLALVRRRCGDIDGALIEDAAASFHFEKVGDIRHSAALENNLGYHLSQAGNFEDAHDHLDRARKMYEKLKDNIGAARVDETRAQAHLLEGHPEKAEILARSAASVFEGSEDTNLAVEAQTTLGKALARLKRFDAAMFTFQRAYQMAEGIGKQAVRVVVGAWVGEAISPMLFDSGFKCDEALMLIEERLIELALVECGGQVTKAALRIGLNSADALRFKMKRYPQLIEALAPIKPRNRGKKKGKSGKRKKKVTVQHV